ncbi:MAG: nucleotidyltransferase family protein [Sphingomonas sp.]|uniref:nucleotidyltransferase family protein n=1 Tax=Sphingomonas sp. TaxID=28214 RepID=UPI0035A853C2|nr:nucleotidyltransferase family protein [Sphingomonas sp.]
MTIGRRGIETVIVAAGLSRRMGKVNKLLLPVAGLPMVRRVAACHARLADRVILVTGFDHAAITEAVFDLDVVVVYNPEFATGQAGSIAIGVAAATLAGRGLMIALADQPNLTLEDLEALVDAFDADDASRVCVPTYLGQRGNPLLFPTALVREMRHDGRAPGCRRFIDANPQLVLNYSAPNDHFTTDVDTPSDAHNILGVFVSDLENEG